jgi:hypothetical protein
LPEAEVVLAPAAIALTLATALGLIAFELDLPFARFGWRQVASLTAAAAVVVGPIPVLGAALPAGVDATSRPPLGVDLSGAAAVMPSTPGAVSWAGDVPHREVVVSEASNSNWRLNVDGEPVTRRKAFGWANSFANERAGNASLGFRTPLTSRLLLLVELALWVLAIRWALRHRRALHA